MFSLTSLPSVGAMATPGHKLHVASWALINILHKSIDDNGLSVFAGSTEHLRQE